MDIVWIIGLSALSFCFTNGIRITLEGLPVTKTPPRIQLPNLPVQSGPTTAPTTEGKQSLRNAVQAAIYCEICQALGRITCINNHCKAPQPTFHRNIVQQTGGIDIFGSVGTATRNTGTFPGATSLASSSLSIVPPSGMVFPISFADIAAIYCAYCIEKSWQECIERYCFNRCRIPPTFTPKPCKNLDQQNDFQLIQTTQRPPRRITFSPRTFLNKPTPRRLRMRTSPISSQRNVFSIPTGKQIVGRTNDQSLAQIFCKFCRLGGWTECINHFCSARTKPTPKPTPKPTSVPLFPPINPVTIRPIDLVGSNTIRTRPTGLLGSNRIRARPTGLLGSNRIRARPTGLLGSNRIRARPTGLLGSNRIRARPTGFRPGINAARPSRRLRSRRLRTLRRRLFLRRQK